MKKNDLLKKYDPFKSENTANIKTDGKNLNLSVPKSILLKKQNAFKSEHPDESTTSSDDQKV